MYIFSLFMSFIISLIPSPIFNCDGDVLTATIRNNLNGDFELINDLESLDQGAFVVLEWREDTVMLPLSFNNGEITFSDKKWLWSYQDNEVGLRSESPRLSHRLQNGKIEEFSCEAIY